MNKPLCVFMNSLHIRCEIEEFEVAVTQLTAVEQSQITKEGVLVLHLHFFPHFLDR